VDRDLARHQLAAGRAPACAGAARAHRSCWKPGDGAQGSRREERGQV